MLVYGGFIASMVLGLLITLPYFFPRRNAFNPTPAKHIRMTVGVALLIVPICALYELLSYTYASLRTDISRMLFIVAFAAFGLLLITAVFYKPRRNSDFVEDPRLWIALNCSMGCLFICLVYLGIFFVNKHEIVCGTPLAQKLDEYKRITTQSIPSELERLKNLNLGILAELADVDRLLRELGALQALSHQDSVTIRAMGITISEQGIHDLKVQIVLLLVGAILGAILGAYASLVAQHRWRVGQTNRQGRRDNP